MIEGLGVPAPRERSRLPFALRPSDLVGMAASLLATGTLIRASDRVAAWPAAGYFGAMCVLPLVARALVARFPRSRAIAWAADFTPLVFFGAWYPHLNAVVDAVGRPLADPFLIRVDQRVFGAQVALSLEGVFPPLVNDVLLAAYTTHFLWPLVTGLVLWWKRRMEAFHEYVAALVTFVAINYGFYALVPAMGPRFAQAGEFHGPVRGALGVAEQVDHAFFESPFLRDCFPSGHTGCALLVLYFTWREQRGLFWVALPVLLALMTATLAGRFHYGIDLVAAVPLVVLSIAAARLGRSALPDGLVLR